MYATKCGKVFENNAMGQQHDDECRCGQVEPQYKPREVQYTPAVDLVVYGEDCKGFEAQDWLELALAALENYRPIGDLRLDRIVTELESFREPVDDFGPPPDPFGETWRHKGAQ